MTGHMGVERVCVCIHLFEHIGNENHMAALVFGHK